MVRGYADLPEGTLGDVQTPDKATPETQDLMSSFLQSNLEQFCAAVVNDGSKLQQQCKLRMQSV